MTNIFPRTRNDEKWWWGSSVTPGSESAYRRTWAMFMSRILPKKATAQDADRLVSDPRPTGIVEL